jgi:uncharacterized protein (DUF2141 family)
MKAWIVAAALAAPGLASAAELKLLITGIEAPKGMVRGAVYDSAATFMQQPKARAVFLVKAERGTVTYRFKDLPPGRYAVATFVDANNNGKLDRNGLNVPMEAYGFSNDAQGAGGPPKFERAAFALPANGRTITFEVAK